MALNAKDLHIAAKREDGMVYLMERFGFSDEAELFVAIRKAVPSKAEGFIKTLEKKEKLFNKRAKNNEASESIETQILEEITEAEAEQQKDVFSDTEECSAEDCEEDVSTIPTLEQLLAQEEELSSKVCEIEVKHKELVSERKVLISNLEKCQNALRELQRLLHVQEENVTKNYEAYFECAAQMEKLTSEKNVYAKQLEVIRQQIEDKKKINIFVYENAEFEVEKLPIEPIADNEVAAQSFRLFELPEAEVLTGKEIKNIAKLLLVVQMVERNGYKAELVFDSAKVQQFWETVIA